MKTEPKLIPFRSQLRYNMHMRTFFSNLAIVGASLLVIASVIFSPIKKAEAASGLAFGGLVSFVTICTCSAAEAIWFTPLWLGNVPVTGYMVYQPATTFLYPGYMIGVPGAWHLGTYTPAVQACYMTVPDACIVLPSYGVIQSTGTSVPGIE